MKRNLICISVAFVTIILLMVMGNIIIVAEKIGQFTRSGMYGEIAFYLLIFGLFFVFIILPIWKVYRAPQIPSMHIDSTMDLHTLRRIGQQLVSGFDYIHDKPTRIKCQKEFEFSLNHTHDADSLRDCINNELQVRLKGSNELGVKGIDFQIKEWAKTVFVVTALSPNSKVDAVSTLVLNFTMMKNMILSMGFRPNNLQMWRLYLRILATSLFSYAVSEALTGVGSVKPLEFLNDIDISDAGNEIDADIEVDADTDSSSLLNILSNLKIPGPIVGPALDGISNALLTLRIGYITRAYLIEGQNLFFNRTRRKEIKREALKDSTMALPSVLTEGSKGLGKGVQTIINLYIRDRESTSNATK